MLCSQCNKQIPDDSSFCSYCGFKIDEPAKADDQAEVVEGAPCAPAVCKEENAPSACDRDGARAAESKESTETDEKQLDSASQNNNHPKRKHTALKVVLIVAAVIIVCIFAFSCSESARLNCLE